MRNETIYRKYFDGELVVIHSLGDGKEYTGVIKGIAIEQPGPARIYIVASELAGEYSCLTIPAACIRDYFDEAGDIKDERHIPNFRLRQVV